MARKSLFLLQQCQKEAAFLWCRNSDKKREVNKLSF